VAIVASPFCRVDTNSLVDDVASLGAPNSV
jgi:hypothetical protein